MSCVNLKQHEFPYMILCLLLRISVIKFLWSPIILYNHDGKYWCLELSYRMVSNHASGLQSFYIAIGCKQNGDAFEKKEVLFEDHDPSCMVRALSFTDNRYSERLHDKMKRFVSKNKAVQMHGSRLLVANRVETNTSIGPIVSRDANLILEMYHHATELPDYQVKRYFSLFVAETIILRIRHISKEGVSRVIIPEKTDNNAWKIKSVVLTTVKNLKSDLFF
ncbi:hypothetical protein Tco_0731851 [Tanacetum coccineum]